MGTSLKERRDAKFAELKDYQSKLMSKGVELSDEETNTVKSLIVEVQGLDAQMEKASEDAELLSKIGALNPAGTEQSQSTNDNDGAKMAKSLGDHFANILRKSGRTLRQKGTIEAPEFLKAATDTNMVGTAWEPALTDVETAPVMPYRRRLMVADLLGAGAVSGDSIRYPVFGAQEGQTGFVAEAAKKPQVHWGDPEWVTDALAELAGWTRISDIMADDLPYIVSEINGSLIYDLQLREEMALLLGDGTNSSLTGILNRNGVQALAPETGETTPDAIFRAITAVQEVTGFAADGIVINPADYQTIRLSKDANGQYFGGGFFAGQYGNGSIMTEPPLWGLATAVTSSIPKGTIGVGAFKTATKVFRKGGIVVESTNSHEDDFTNDRITIRAKERLGLQVKYPSAIVKLTLPGEPTP